MAILLVIFAKGRFATTYSKSHDQKKKFFQPPFPNSSRSDKKSSNGLQTTRLTLYANSTTYLSEKTLLWSMTIWLTSFGSETYTNYANNLVRLFYVKTHEFWTKIHAVQTTQTFCVIHNSSKDIRASKRNPNVSYSTVFSGFVHKCMWPMIGRLRTEGGYRNCFRL
jgi:hypothetical protein